MEKTPALSAVALAADAPARSSSQWRVARLVALVIVVAWTCIFFRLGGLPLLQPDEGRNAEVAREMLASDSWLVPTYNGLAYLDKPAFYFRLVAESLRTFGNTEAAARLPSALSAAALLLLIAGFCKRVYGTRAAILAVAIVASTPLFFAFARIVIFDMTLALFVCGAVFAGYLAEEPGTSERWRRRWYLCGAAAIGLATLVKGPVGFLLPALVMLAFNKLDGRRGAVRRMFAPGNLLVFLALVLPWFAGVSILRPDFPYYGIVMESLSRFSTGSFHRTAPFYYYAPVIAGVMFPWSVMVLALGRRAWLERARWSSADRLFVIWTVVVVLFFSISQSKLPGYVLTAVIALGILLARAFDAAWDQDGDSPGVRRAIQRGALLLCLVLVACTALLGFGALDAAGFQRLLRIRDAVYRGAAPVLLPAAIAMGLAAAVMLVALMSRKVRLTLLACLIPPLSLPLLAFGGAREYAEAHSASNLAQAVEANAPGVRLACLQCFPNGLPFYLGRPVTVISENGEELTSNYIMYTLSGNEEWPPVVVPLGQRDSWIASLDEHVLLMADRHQRLALDSIAITRGTTVDSLAPDWFGVLIAPDHAEGN
jgi:hypothetical protein